ncbi:MAG: N-acetylglucosamine-6-phosphate deacetylase, partial [Erysipelotrichia bacterium]|nr:N-acetylglucosamine-6-phosphate deacetylase [Erysipelotrichia bacterium]
MDILRSTRIYFEDGVRDGYLVLDNGHISGFLTKDTAVDSYTDYGTQRIIPGIFDTHDHGIYGYGDSEMAATHDDELIKDDIRHYLHALTYEGVTNILPTETETLKQVAEIATEGYEDGAFIQGIHSEGPYLQRVGEGGRPEPHPDVDMEYIHQMWEDSKGLLKLIAMAPEIPGTKEAAQFLISKGVKIAFAHSDAKAAEARQAVDDGWRVSTHTSN